VISKSPTAAEAVHAAHLATGRRFLEWAAVSVSLPASPQLGFDAIGIEIESPLVEIADDLAAAHDIDAEFLCGSLSPTARSNRRTADFAWLSGSRRLRRTGPRAQRLRPHFAYPWPGEEQITSTSSQPTPPPALTTYGIEGVRLQRKTGKACHKGTEFPEKTRENAIYTNATDNLNKINLLLRNCLDCVPRLLLCALCVCG
jgi:hypothetical protein